MARHLAHIENEFSLNLNNSLLILFVALCIIEMVKSLQEEKAIADKVLEGAV